jgi:hypothetical protein
MLRRMWVGAGRVAIAIAIFVGAVALGLGFGEAIDHFGWYVGAPLIVLVFLVMSYMAGDNR